MIIGLRNNARIFNNNLKEKKEKEIIKARYIFQQNCFITCQKGSCLFNFKLEAWSANLNDFKLNYLKQKSISREKIIGTNP